MRRMVWTGGIGRWSDDHEVRARLARFLAILWGIVVWTTTLVVVAFVVVLVFTLVLASKAADKPQR